MMNLTERHLQAIWYDSALRPRHLTTRRGSVVDVISPGVWNLESGPDFKDAVLEVGSNRQRVIGDVEVHLCPSDWDLHGHGADDNYRNVIAHVTWGCGPNPKSLPSGAITIWLGRFVNSNPLFDLAQIDLTAYPYARSPSGKCLCEERLDGNLSRTREILMEAGRVRLGMKARRLEGRIVELSGHEKQIFYEEVMATLGYRHNARQFSRVARRIPVGELPIDVNEAKVALLTAASFEEWNRVGVRPNNTPEVRLERAARLFRQTSILELAEAKDFSEKACRQMVAAICKDVEGMSCLGRGRAGAVMTNVIVPWALAVGRIHQAPEWLPPEDMSNELRLMAFRLLGRDHSPRAHYAKNGLLMQGLYQLYRDTCRRTYPDCTTCRLGGDLIA